MGIETRRCTVDSAARPTIFITGLVGFLGFLPLGGVLSGVAWAYGSSKVDFKDPSARGDSIAR